MSSNNEVAVITFSEMERLAQSIAASGLFGLKTKDQAFALMAIAQAEGMHPAIAAMEYNIIQGKPSRTAEAILARFQKAGGKVEWHDYNDEKVSATFSHPQGGRVKIEWDMARAERAGLTGKDNWKKWPRNMLRSRVISEGARTVFPGSTNNFYTPDEVEEFDKKDDKTIDIPHDTFINQDQPKPPTSSIFIDSPLNRRILFDIACATASHFKVDVVKDRVFIQEVCLKVLNKKPLTNDLAKIIDQTFEEQLKVNNNYDV